MLVKTVVDEVNRRPEEARHIIDLYCGVGVFGLSALAGDPTRRLTGVESGRRAVEFARRNAASHGVKAEFFAGETRQMLRKLDCDGGTTVIVDPPRGGMERATTEFLMRSAVPRIFYVSCDPATLQRDLRTLLGAYEVESVKWFDMFPRTARFETLVVLRRKN
jgi:tRNA/tmRNA/rRNA uracil-C5-methylase (TrmA/RlmC/RlmD family)